MASDPSKNPAHKKGLAHTIQVGIYFLVALFALFVFFNISGLGTSRNISYAFVAFALVVLIVMPRQFPDGGAADAAAPKAARALGGLGARITTTYFLAELVAAAVFIGPVQDSALFAFFVQTGVYVVYLSYVAYQSNAMVSDTPQARAAQRGKKAGREAMPRLLSQASALADAAKGTPYEEQAARIERVLAKGPKDSFQGTLEIEEQMGAFFYEFTTLLREGGDDETMRDCARLLLGLAEERNRICS